MLDRDPSARAAICVGDPRPLLDALEQAPGVGRRRYLVHRLEQVLEAVEPYELEDDLAERARALGVVVEPPEPAPPTAVRVPFVGIGAHTLPFVRAVFVTFRPYAELVDGLDGVLAAAARTSVRGALELAARHLGRPRSLEGYALAAVRPAAFVGARVDGGSLGAATFLSACSTWTRRPVRADVVVTGALRGGKVVGVGRIDAKLEAARRARGVARLVVPVADRAALPKRVRGLEIVAVRTPEELVEAALETRTVTSDVESRLRELELAFRGAWRDGSWERLRADLEPLLAELPTTRPDLQVVAHAMLGAALRHLGEPERSLAVVRRGEHARDDDPEGVPDRARSLLARQKAMTLRQLGAFDEAERAAREAVTSARRGRLRGELIPSLGTAGLLARSRGRGSRAVAHLHEALALSERHAPSSASRAAAYLVEALGARGQLDEARQAYARGLATLAHERDGARAGRERWLRVALASVLVRHAAASGAAGEAALAEACELLDVPFVRESVVHEPLPGLLVRRWLGIALARLGQRRGLELLGDSPTAFGRSLRGHPLALAQQNVLHELVVRVERRAVDADARARARLALDGMPVFDAARPLVPSARAELEREAPRARPLVALLEACDRLG